MSQDSARAPHAPLDIVDPVWETLRLEAEKVVAGEPVLAGFIYSSILNQKTLEEAVTERISDSLGRQDVPSALLRQEFDAVLDVHGDDIGQAIRADLVAVRDRDPACDSFVQAILYFKGFQAIQAHRFAHALWKMGRKELALYLQAKSSRIYQTDINPAAKFGRGIMFDHATGIVIGETAEIGDDVSILQGVTLGGTGKEEGDRHPKIRDCVLIGAGAQVLGNIEVGHCSLVAAGSVVVKPVPPRTSVAGVPAKVIGEVGCPQPARSMFHFGTLD